MIKKVNRKEIRVRKHVRVRKKVFGTAECPRLAVFRSASHIYAQIIDDEKGVTLAAASTLDEAVKANIEYGGNIDAAKEVGKVIAERAIAAGINDVVFDRGGFLYTGRIQALADGAREAGLNF